MTDILVRSEETGGEACAVGTPDGRVFIASSAGNGGELLRVAALSAAGVLSWDYSIDGNENPYEPAIKWDAVNSKLITAVGIDPGFEGNLNLVVYRTNVAGASPVDDWVKTLTFADDAKLITATTDYVGDVLLVGRYAYTEVFAVKLAASTGAVLWANSYTIDGASAFTVSAASQDPSNQTLVVVGARTSTQGYLLEINSSTGVSSSRETFTWPGLSGVTSFEVFRGVSSRAWISGHGGVTDPGNASCYTFTAGTRISGAYDGSNYFLAEKTNSTTVKLHKLSTGFAAVDALTIGYNGAGGLYLPRSVGLTSSEVVLALTTGYGVHPSFTLRADKGLGVSGTFDDFTLSPATAASGSSVSGTYGTFTSTKTVLTPSTTSSGPTWLEESPITYTEALPLVTAETGTVAGSLPHLVSAFIGSNSVQGNLPKLTASLAAMNPTVDGSVARTLPKLTAASTLIAVQYGTVAKALPKLTAAVVGFAGTAVSAGEIKLSRLVGNLGGPGAGCSGEILTALPQLDSQLYGGQQSTTPTMPAIKGELTALSTILGGLAGQLPLPTAELVGTVANAGVIASSLPRAVGELTLIQGNVATISATLRGMSSGLTMVGGSAGSITAKLPEPTAVFTGSAAVLAVLVARLPRLSSAFPMYRFYQHVLTHVMNTHTTAVTTFENYPFNSFAKIGDKYYGAGPSGLYEIDSEPTDAVAAIPWRMLTGQLDFGSAMQKRLSDFYIAMRSAGDVALTVAVDEQEPYEYSLQATDIDRLKQRKVLLGKGLRGRYWQFGLSGTDDFDMDAYSMTVLDTARRI